MPVEKGITKRMRNKSVLCLAFGAALLVVSPAWCASVNSYQVTGPVLEVTSETITVQKGKDRWELARDTATKASVEPKVGDKVTIQYRMVATQIDVKPVKKSK